MIVSVGWIMFNEHRAAHVTMQIVRFSPHESSRSDSRTLGEGSDLPIYYTGLYIYS